ncbi:FG-GAP-like repeat-containing protein [Streptomyces sp. NPDC047928]|uniref:FG-GAP-like repeat-containing protein n=1 Tax=unclassified Streptomyces TaxID=2593676 RepID=UPI0037245486
MALAVLAGVVASGGLTAPAATAAEAVDGPAGSVVAPPSPRFVPRATQILNAGETGFLYAREDDDRLLWTEYATGATTALATRLPRKLAYDVFNARFTVNAADVAGYFGAGSDTVAVYAASPTPHVTLRQGAGATGDTVVIPIPAGQVYSGTFGTTVLTATMADGEVTGHHLLRMVSGTVEDREITGLPAGAVPSRYADDGDSGAVILRYRNGDENAPDTLDRWVMVDLATAAASALPDRPDPENPWEVQGFRLGKDTLLRQRPGRYAMDVLDRKDPSGAVLRTYAGTGDGSGVAPVGMSLLLAYGTETGNNDYRGGPLVRPTATEGTRQLLDSARADLAVAPDGSVVVAGAEKAPHQGETDWAFYRFSPAADGSLTRQRVATVQPMPAHVYGLSLGSGILTTADSGTTFQPHTYLGGYRSTWLSTTGAPTALRSTADGLVSGRDSGCTDLDERCVTMWASGDGHHGREQATEAGDTVLRENGATAWGPRLDTGDSSPELADLSGRYGVVDGASSGQQYITEFRDGTPGSTVLTRRSRVASAVWGATLWSAGATGGEVVATTLPTGTRQASFTTRNGCTPNELQAVGRWVYWRCFDYFRDRGAGVYDRVTGRTVTAPTGGNTLLGDGYLVQGGEQSGLTLYDLHAGLPASGAHTDLPRADLVSAAQLGRHTRARTAWTVDRFGGHVAYVGDDNLVRVVPTGVPASDLSVIDSRPAAATLDLGTEGASWHGTWWLSKPAASWRIAVQRADSGVTVRTLQGGEARGVLTASWDGKDAHGDPVLDGSYRLVLTAKAADGRGPDLVVPSPVRVTGGSVARRDHNADGRSDLLTLNPSGVLAIRYGTGAGGFSGFVTGSGWSTSTVFVPFGDTDGDRCNDVLVRMPSGELRSYRPGCGGPLTPTSPYRSLGTVYGQFDVLTSPGDLTGDGRADLLARQASTGDMYLYADNGAGALKTVGRVAANWKSYRAVFGAGDLDGDGHGDVLAVDGANSLWRYDGTATGTLKPRVLVFGNNWGNGRNTFVGVGDVTGDGRADLISRHTAGYLYRNDGRGNGSFGPTAQIGTGWQNYRLF